MRTAAVLALTVLLTACSHAGGQAATGGKASTAAAPATAARSTADPARAACARFRALADQADATGTTEADMRRDLAAMAAVPAPPALAALFREIAADDLAIVNGTKGTIPGLLAAIRELNADCPAS